MVTTFVGQKKPYSSIRTVYSGNMDGGMAAVCCPDDHSQKYIKHITFPWRQFVLTAESLSKVMLQYPTCMNQI